MKKSIKKLTHKSFSTLKNIIEDILYSIINSRPVYFITEIYLACYRALIKYKNLIFISTLYSFIFTSLCFIGYIAMQSLKKSVSKTTFASTPIEKLGTFGDFFGGITNPIIGTVGFIAITITISMQIKQNKETIKQNFESSFFNLLNMQNSIIENLVFDKATARASFSKFLIVNKSTLFPNDIYNFKTVVKKSKARIFYTQHNSTNNDVFGHYFRNMYRILKMIHDAKYSEEEKRRHARTLRAQLSMDELTVLFLNCLPGVCDKGEFCNLLIDYQILEHLSIKRLNSSQITRFNYKYSEFIIGGKIRVGYKEVNSYLKKETNYYYNHSNFGAFGRNSSDDLAALKRYLIMFNR